MNESSLMLWREGDLQLAPCCVTLAKAPAHSVPQSPLMYNEEGGHLLEPVLIFQKTSKSTAKFLRGEWWGSCVHRALPSPGQGPGSLVPTACLSISLPPAFLLPLFSVSGSYE